MAAARDATSGRLRFRGRSQAPDTWPPAPFAIASSEG
jgi:hypothetical protein